MRTLRLPETEIEVSALCFGMGSVGTGVRGEKADRLIAAFLEAGGNFFDTAHCYCFWEENGLGASERELGASLRRLGALERAVIATKGGHPDGGAQYPRPDAYLAPEVIASDIAESVERLDVPTIDLYFLHRDDPRVPVGEILTMLNGEIAQGRLRALGASNWSVERIAEANAYAAQHGLAGFVASQVQWSLAEPNWEPSPDPTPRFVTPADAGWYAEAQIPIVAYSATAGGYFAGRGHDKGLYPDPANLARHARACELARQFDSTPTQIALAWLRHQVAPTIPLFGTTDLQHLTEALDAVSIVLTPEQVRWLRDG